MCNTFLSIVGARLPRFLGGVSCNKASLFLIQRLRDESKERLQWRLRFALLSCSVAAVLLHKIKPKLYAILPENITYNTPYVLRAAACKDREFAVNDQILRIALILPKKSPLVNHFQKSYLKVPATF